MIKKIRENELGEQSVWMKVTSRLANKGNCTEDLGLVSVTYVPDKKVIDLFEVEPSCLAIDDLAKNILEEIKRQIQPKYLEVVIQFSSGKSIFMNYGSDEGWEQVATFRFSEPKI